VDVVDGALLDRVEQVLVPYVVVAVVLPRLGHGALCVRAAVEVEEEEPVALQAVADLREVLHQLVSGLEDEVREVEGDGDVHRLVHDLPHVAFQEPDAAGLLVVERGQVVLPSPGERVGT
jgi:hypothetical protein